MPSSLSNLLVVACWITTAAAFSPANHLKLAARTTVGPLHEATATASSAIPVYDGVSKTIVKQGRADERLRVGDIATVKYTCYLPEQKESGVFARSENQKLVVGEGTMIPAWDRALMSMCVGESATISVTDPELGYGEQGVPPLVPPNSPLQFSIEVLATQSPTTTIDFDSLAMGSTPSTAREIQAAYERRQAEKLATEGPAKEGFEGFIERAKNFYFFGLFEGETGQEAPWFLRPSITFPLAFFIIGATFYISFATGAITERGASVTDELDEIILTNLIVSIDAATRSAISITSEHLS